MLSSSATTDMECNKKTLNSSRGSSSPSSTTALSPSSSSTSTPTHQFSPNNSFSHQAPTTLTPNKKNSIEHVWNWKHINHNDHTTLPNVTPATSSTLFQLLTHTIATSASSALPLVSALSLSSHHSHKELHLVQPQQHHPNNNTASKVKAFSNNNPFQNMACSSDSLSSLVRKRFLDSDGNKSGDRRNKRMMKNRESAARFRARKQAYTLELQQRLKQLLEEKARLKSQHEQLRETAAIQQKRKHNRYRASSAPF